MYRGDLLEGCYDDWVLSERDRLRAAAGAVFAALLDVAWRRGDVASAVQLGDRLLRFDPLAESTYRRLMEIHAGESVEIPPRLQAVIESRLDQLSEPAREIASAAAVVGRGFTLDIVGAMVDEQNNTVAAIDELWRRAIVGEHGLEDYDFRHDKIREVAYMTIGRPAGAACTVPSPPPLEGPANREVRPSSPSISSAPARWTRRSQPIDAPSSTPQLSLPTRT